MPANTLTRPATSSRPRAWQQGDRVKLRPDVCHHEKYRAVKGLIGVIELANESDPFSPLGPIANVEFNHPDLPKPIRVTDIPFSYLQTAHPMADNTLHEDGQKPKRRSPLNLHVVKDTRTEAEKQAEGIAWLTQRGYVVLVVGQYMKKVNCEECGTWFWPKGFGNSVGFPDTALFHPRRWSGESGRVPVLLQEWKQNEKSDRRAEQIKLAGQGASTFVWSLQMCLADLVAFEQELGFDPHHDALEYLERHTPKEPQSSTK